ncbi:hypothetical protein [Bacillus thuringiensis]
MEIKKFEGVSASKKEEIVKLFLDTIKKKSPEKESEYIEESFRI